jgi:gas vesicle protein
VVGRRWRIRARVVPLFLGTLLGVAVGGTAAATTLTRREVMMEQTDYVLAKGTILGGAIGLATAWVAYPKRRPAAARERPTAVPAA